MSALNLEARVVALEAEVAQLKDQLAKSPTKSWENIVGTFSNDPVYEKAMEYGRKYRESTRPKVKKTSRKRKHGSA